MRNYMFLMLLALAAVCITSHVQAGRIDPNFVEATASSHVWDPNQNPNHAADWSGVYWALQDATGQYEWVHTVLDYETAWLSGKAADSEPNVNPGTVDGTHWIRFDFDKVYRLDKMDVWNYPVLGGGADQLLGMSNVTVEYSATGGSSPDDWETAFEGTFGVSQAYSRGENPASSDTTVIFGGVAAKSIVITSPVIGGPTMQDCWTSLKAWNFHSMVMACFNEQTEVGLGEVAFYTLEPTTCIEANQFGYGLEGDVDGDCYVTLADFADAAAGWLSCAEPTDIDCTHPWEL